jgi:Protein of unknown function (DUF742)
MTDDSSPVRPYLDQPPARGQAADPNVSPLRPYLLTSGRAEPVDESLEIEAQVLTNQLNAALQGGLAFEHRDIVTLCTSPVSPTWPPPAFSSSGDPPLGYPTTWT